MFPNFVEPLLYLGAMGLGLGAFIQQGGINGQTYVQFIAPGLLASNAMFAASFESTFDTFVKLRFDKVYDAIITTPVNAEDIIAGEYLWAGTRSALYGTAFLIVLIALGLIGSPWAVLIPPMLLIIGDHVQRHGHAVYEPHPPDRLLLVLLHPGGDAALSSLGDILPRRRLPGAGAPDRLVHPALPRGQRLPGSGLRSDAGDAGGLAWILVFTVALALAPDPDHAPPPRLLRRPIGVRF